MGCFAVKDSDDSRKSCSTLKDRVWKTINSHKLRSALKDRVEHYQLLHL